MVEKASSSYGVQEEKRREVPVVSISLQGHIPRNLTSSYKTPPQSTHHLPIMPQAGKQGFNRSAFGTLIQT
jgi:hypothetical protein